VQQVLDEAECKFQASLLELKKQIGGNQKPDMSTYFLKEAHAQPDLFL
jgi:hypothetical protein